MSLDAPRRAPTVTRIADLVDHGLIDSRVAPDLERVVETFSLRITAEMAGAMQAGDADDPLIRQFVPGTAELDIAPDENGDPIGDSVHEVAPGLVHRYPDRVLLKPTHLCQVYCRFCFRRETVGSTESGLDPADLTAAITHIRGDPSIFEVILSGGDPLVLSDRRLGAVLKALDDIPHVQVVRFHTRVPVVDPGRITERFLRLLDRRVAIWFVLHVNHGAELTENALKSIRAISRSGIPLLAQTVLLKGVNDDPAVLEALFRRLVANRVKPYYLHHLDRAKGTSQFRTRIAEGRAIMRALRRNLTGIAQPTYVLDIPGGYGKVPIGPEYLTVDPNGTCRVTDPNGIIHDYRDA